LTLSKFTSLLILILCAISIFAQGDAYLRITDYGTGVMKIAVPDFEPHSGDFGDYDTIRTMMAEVLRDDLNFSPFLDVVDKVFYPVTRVGLKEDLDPFSWSNIGANTIIRGDFDTDKRSVFVEIHIYSISNSHRLMKKTYESKINQARRLVHKISDDIHKALTGEKGVAQTQIAFISDRYGGYKELYVCDYDGYAPRRITNAKSIVLSPAWSTGGDKLSYTSFVNGKADIYMYDIYKERETLLANHPGSNLTAAWSPDNRYIAYSRVCDDNAELFLMDARTGEETRLTYTLYSIETGPCFSPTGREIAFTSDRSGTPQIFIMDIMGSNVRRLTYEGKYNTSASWSPRGDKICCTSQTEFGYDIALIDIATGTPMYLTCVGSNENPSWAPDGYHIVFSSNRSGSYQLYTMNWDGTDVNRITNGGTNKMPAWSCRYTWSFD